MTPWAREEATGVVKPVILLVEDEEDLLSVLSEAITMKFPDYEVASASTPEQAEALLDDLEATGSELALLIVDHQLGGDRTGLDLLESRNMKVPSIIFTGQAPPAVERRALAFGAKVLWKPIPLKTLLAEVTALL